jgi:hypothetical protein
MSDKKLFSLDLATPTNSKRIVFGDTSENANNITFGNLKTWLGIQDVQFKTKMFEIGPWDMDTTQTATVPIYSGVSSFGGWTTYFSIPVSKIRGVRVLVRNNTNTIFVELNSVQNGTALTNPAIQLWELTGFFGTSTVATLMRRQGSALDNASFGGTGFNRGWIIVDYVD